MHHGRANIALVLTSYYINREWILSAKARNVYRLCAGMTLALLITMVASLMGLADQIPHGLVPVVKLFVLLCVLGTAVTAVAMEYFWFAFDTSSALSKAFWFCALIFFLVGPPLYCFLVYSRAKVFREGLHAKSAAHS